MGELVNMASQFQGLPMDSLIGGPLRAAADAQTMLASSTAAFINSVGFEWVYTPPSKKGEKGVWERKIRTAEFEYESTELDPNGKPYIKETKIVVPLLAIVPIPNLQIDTVDITFDMEVKSSFSEKATEKRDIAFEAELSGKIGPFNVRVKVNGAASSAKETTRSSDNSAKYHVAVHATNHGMPEGLQRVMDMMAASTAPRRELAYEMNELGEKTGTPKPIAYATSETETEVKAPPAVAPAATTPT